MKYLLCIIAALFTLQPCFGQGVVGELLEKPTMNKYEAEIISEAQKLNDDKKAYALLSEHSSKSWAGAPLLFNLGNISYKGGRYSEAEQHYKKALEKQKFFACYKNLGYALAAQSKLPEARRAFLKALAISGNSDVQCLMWLADNSAGNGDYTAALAMCAQALIYQPDNADLMYAQSLFLSKTGMFSSAISAAFAAFEKTGQSRFLKVCAMCAVELGDKPGALSYMEMFGALDALERSDLFLMGDLYLSIGARAKAVDLYARAPFSDTKLANAAFASLNAGDFQTARIAASKIADAPLRLRVSGLAAARASKNWEAKEKLESYLKKNKTDMLVTAELAEVYFSLKDYVSSAAMFARLRADPSREKTALYGLLRSAVARKSYAQAVAYAEEIAQKYPSREIEKVEKKLREYADEMEKSPR